MENALWASCQLPIMVQKGGQEGYKEVAGDRGKRPGLQAGLWHPFGTKMSRTFPLFWAPVLSPKKRSMFECQSLTLT